MNLLRDALTVLSGFGVGVLSGVMGVGGGIVLVPLMVLGFGLSQPVAQGTSLAAIIPSAIVGTVINLRAGQVMVRAATWMGATGVIGAILGAALAVHVQPQILVRVFGAFLVVSAYQIWPRERTKVDGDE